MNGSRTYLYVGVMGTQFSLNGTTCNYIGRTYRGASSWITETMQGGIASDFLTGSTVYGLDVNPTYNWDSTWGYRHLVYVSGVFNHIGGSSGSYSTNVAQWNEAYSSSNPWFALGGSGRGLTYQFNDPLNSCATTAYYPQGPVWSQAMSGTNVYYLGGFNKVDNTTYVVADGVCGYHAPIGVAKAASQTLGLVGSKAVYSFDGYQQQFRDTSIAATGSDVYVSSYQGVIVANTGLNPATGTVAAGWRYNGSTWSTIGGTSSAGTQAPVAFEGVAAAGGVAFFIRNDGYQDIYKYTP